jgi:gamma-glutamylaminecyclotransferase
MAKVFAFGTLKRGFPLHSAGLSGATFIGPYRTASPYPMVIAGPRFAPMMFDQPGVGLQVTGELYEVDETGLARLDEIESVGSPGNFRVLVLVEPVAEGPPVVAFAYMKAVELAQPIHTPYLASYSDDRFIPGPKTVGAAPDTRSH